MNKREFLKLTCKALVGLPLMTLAAELAHAGVQPEHDQPTSRNIQSPWVLECDGQFVGFVTSVSETQDRTVIQIKGLTEEPHIIMCGIGDEANYNIAMCGDRQEFVAIRWKVTVSGSPGQQVVPFKMDLVLTGTSAHERHPHLMLPVDYM